MSQLYRTMTGQSQDSGAPAALSKTTTTDPQTGVLNHLTPQQDEALEKFKERLEQDGWWKPDGVNGKPTHDDGTLLRYLRARKFDIEGAVHQFSDTEKWMKEQKVEELYEHFDVDIYERARLMYPQWTGHRDKRGIPIYVFEIKGLDSKHISKYQKESAAYKAKLPNHKNLSTPPKLLPLFALYHNLLNFVLPLVSSLDRPHPEIPVTNSTNIVDITNVGLAQFWNLKQHMQDASVLATAHYPETLDRIFIIGAPSFFPTVWGWVKRWFDPVTVSKIFILGKHEVKSTLTSFMDPKSIPKKYGGELDWSWGDNPDLDDELRQVLEKDGNKGWVRGPALWLDHERIVVGSENGKLRRSDAEIAEKKPIVYAADYTEEPVHADRKASRASTTSMKGTATKTIAPVSETTTGHPGDGPNSMPPPTLYNATNTTSDTAGVAAAHTRNSIERSDIPHENIRTSPMGDSQLNLPNAQPAAPATTAEYISPIPSREPQHISPPAEKEVSSVKAPEPKAPVPVSAPASAPAPAPMVSSATNGSHPAGHTQPGPLPSHTVQVNRIIAQKLEGESISVIPATANGALPHPDIITASDMSKGLAMEADKLALNGSATRPHPERFVTAAEF